LKKNEFLRFFKICYTVQNVDKGNKIAKTGHKNLFFVLILNLLVPDGNFRVYKRKLFHFIRSHQELNMIP
jgi:hypothetical protein